MEKERDSVLENGTGKKKLIIIISMAVVLVVAIGVLLFLILGKKSESYRIIKVYEMNGEATVYRAEIGEISAYNNMVLQSGDKVVLNSGRMTLQLDEDKYVYVEEGSELIIEAEGDAANSKTTILLTQGAITNEIQNKLSSESTYEVNTPNSTMSVRGTIFRVSVYEGEDGVFYTKVCVFDGAVETNLIYADGTPADNSKQLDVDHGNQVVIFEDDITTDYLNGIEEIDYDDLPEEVQELLETLFEEMPTMSQTGGQDAATTIEKPGPFTVTFLYHNSVFGTQTVEKNTCATEPALMPEAAGHWDFDFSKAITDDVEINWVSE